MTKEELIAALSGEFCENFAGDLAGQVCAASCTGLLYDVATSRYEGLPAARRHKILFRSAYVLERIYFMEPEMFRVHAEAFCRTDFVACTDPSARRHFAKIMAHLLGNYEPAPACLENIAESAAQWILDPEAKVSVKVWSVEVLKYCRKRIGWVADTWDDLLEALSQEATPGIECRLRKNWRPVTR